MSDVLVRDAEIPADREFRLTLRLSPEVRNALEWVAKERDVSLTDAIRHAISTEKYLVEASKRNARILIDQPGERLKEVVMR